MRFQVEIDDELLTRAKELTGLRRTNDVARAALQVLVENEERRRLSQLNAETIRKKKAKTRS
jgi:Arc/MetJ family transcription regulator